MITCGRKSGNTFCGARSGHAENARSALCVAARSELFCPKCGRIEFGVEREVYLAAKYYVDTFHFNMYQGLEDNEQRRRMNIAKISEIMDWQNDKLGISDENGFCVPLDIKPDALGRTSIFRDSDLAEGE